MRQDNLARIISNADFGSFREIARIFLDNIGYRPILADGPYDGGNDFRIMTRPPNPEQFAVQVSVERDWRKKIEKDTTLVAKAGFTAMLFLSSRRIPEGSFLPIQQSLETKRGVRVVRFDAQGIATLALTDGYWREILDALGIPLLGPDDDHAVLDARTSVAYAAALLNRDTDDFRHSIIEQLLCSLVVESKVSPSREIAERQTCDVLGLAKSQEGIVRGAVDRLIQRGDLEVSSSKLQVSRHLRDALSANNTLYAQAKAELAELLGTLLGRYVEVVSAEFVSDILRDLGSLMLTVGDAVASRGSIFRSELQPKLHRVRTTLALAGVSEARLDIAMKEVADAGSQSPFGAQLQAGEMFLQLTRMRPTHLAHALGSDAPLNLVLDASVAIPLLCSLAFETAQQRFFIAAHHMFKQSSCHGIKCILPSVYLEEAASHLVNAARDYAAVADLDDDLSSSRNAFVAHYVALRIAGRRPPATFHEYLKHYGYSANLSQADFFVARDIVYKALAEAYQSYGIEIKDPADLERGTEHRVRAAATAVGQKHKPDLLVEHDARVIHSIETAATTPRSWIFCTWDRMIFHLAAGPEVAWTPMDPASLGDMLAVLQGNEGPASTISVELLAMSVTEAAAERGAGVWDAIVGQERELLYDAELRAQAKAFKQAYLQDLAPDADVLVQWEEWKKEHVSRALAPDR